MMDSDFCLFNFIVLIPNDEVMGNWGCKNDET